MSTEVTLASNGLYLDMLSDCMVASEQELDNEFTKGLFLMSSQFQSVLGGDSSGFTAYWKDTAAHQPWPSALTDLSERLDTEYWDALLRSCDTVYMDEYGALISRDLLPETTLVRRYDLFFKKTEQGWKGF